MTVEDKVMKDKSYAGRDLVGLNFSGYDLRGTDFSSANLTGCNFSNAKMNGCVLSRVNIKNVTGNNKQIRNIQGFDSFWEDDRHKRYHVVYTKDMLQIGDWQYAINDWKRLNRKDVERFGGHKGGHFWDRYGKLILSWIASNPAR